MCIRDRCATTLKLREAAARAAEARAAELAAAERARLAAEAARRRGRAIVSAVVSTYLRVYVPELAPADFLVDFNIHSVRARKKAKNIATRPGLIALARMTRNELTVGFEKWREGTRLLREEERVARAGQIYSAMQSSRRVRAQDSRSSAARLRQRTTSSSSSFTSDGKSMRSTACV